MDNRENTAPETEKKKTGAGVKKKSTQFQKGKSGNPSGRPKMTEEERRTRALFRKLGPKAVKKLGEMLEADRLSSIARVRIIEIILERTFGKVESAVKVTNAQESVEAAQQELEAIFASYDQGSEEGVLH